jgi:hypothetical protein
VTWAGGGLHDDEDASQSVVLDGSLAFTLNSKTEAVCVYPWLSWLYLTTKDSSCIYFDFDEFAAVFVPEGYEYAQSAAL